MAIILDKLLHCLQGHGNFIIYDEPELSRNDLDNNTFKTFLQKNNDVRFNELMHYKVNLIHISHAYILAKQAKSHANQYLKLNINHM